MDLVEDGENPHKQDKTCACKLCNKHLSSEKCFHCWNVPSTCLESAIYLSSEMCWGFFWFVLLGFFVFLIWLQHWEHNYNFLYYINFYI